MVESGRINLDETNKILDGIKSRYRETVSGQLNLRCRNEVLESSAIFSIEKQNPKMIIRSIEDGNRTARNQIRFETTLAVLIWVVLVLRFFLAALILAFTAF